MARRPTASDEALVELFLDMLAAERGAGDNTLDAYRNDLADFSAHLHAAGRGIASADTDDLRGFLGALDERGFAASSLARRLSAMRQLYRFLYAEGIRSDDPAAVLEGPKRGRSVPKVLTIAEVDGLLAQARRDMEDKTKPPASACARRGSCACSKSSTRPDCAFPNWWRCRPQPPSATSACWWCAARATRNGWCRSTGGQARHGRLSRAARRGRARRRRKRNGCSRRSARAGI